MKNEINSNLVYKLEKVIGRGGMGFICRAKRKNMLFSDLEDSVVLKFLLDSDADNVEKLVEEAKVSMLFCDHENIVNMYGIENLSVGNMSNQVKRIISKYTGSNKVDDAYCMIMEYINGPDLKEFNEETHLENGKLIPVPISAFSISKICDALEYAHEYILHRDISPENIMLTPKGSPKLADFGVAVYKTAEMKFVGKLPYMSTELLGMESDLDERIDIFALGMSFYELLTGFNPLMPTPGLSIDECRVNLVMRQINGIPSPKEVRPDVPEELSNIVSKMIAENKEERYKHIEEVNNDIKKDYLFNLDFVPNENLVATYLTKFYFCVESSLERRKERFYLDVLGSYPVEQVERNFSYDDYSDCGVEVIEKTLKGYPVYSLLEFGK